MGKVIGQGREVFSREGMVGMAKAISRRGAFKTIFTFILRALRSH
jgi:hypothetical protein